MSEDAIIAGQQHGEQARTPADRVGFDRYVLDTGRGCLTSEGGEVQLRPKTFAVLVHLVRNPQRLISKDELFAAAWPGAAVTDDVPVQSIGELRKALGSDGTRLIKTVPRKVAEIGPVPVIEAPEYPLRVNHAGGPPGCKTPVRTSIRSSCSSWMQPGRSRRPPSSIDRAEGRLRQHLS